MKLLERLEHAEHECGDRYSAELFSKARGEIESLSLLRADFEDAKLRNDGLMFSVRSQQEDIESLRIQLAERDEDIERLREALGPFALYATVFEGREDFMTEVHETGHQAITVGAFQTARSAIFPEKHPAETEDDGEPEFWALSERDGGG